MSDSNWYSGWYKKKNEEYFKAQEPKEEIKITLKKLEKFKQVPVQDFEETKPAEKTIKSPGLNKKLNKNLVLFASLLIVIIIVSLLYLLTKTPAKTDFQPFNIIIKNSSDFPIDIYYKDSPLISFSLWESRLEYSNISDRFFGKEDYRKIFFDDFGKAYTALILDDSITIETLSTNPEKVTKIGWFTRPEQVSINETNLKKIKTVGLRFYDSKNISESKIDYYFYKNQPCFKIQFSAKIENQSKLGNFAYGFLLKDYDIYLSNGTIIKNDNKITDINKSPGIILKEKGKISKNISRDLTNSIAKEISIPKNSVIRKGSFYKVNGSEYQIFYNKNLKKAIIIYSPDILYFENSFYWNYYLAYVPYANEGEDNFYPPVYVLTIENPELSYNQETKEWNIDSKQYSGDATVYIYEKVFEIEAPED